MALKGPEIIDAAITTNVTYQTTIDLQNVNSSGFALLNGVAIAGNWTSSTPAAKTFADGDVTTGTDSVAIASHGYLTGDLVRLTTDGTLPGGLNTGTDYWVIKVSAGVIKFAASLADALANTPVDITSAAGGGTHTITATTAAGAVNIQHSIDGSVWSAVPTAQGGASQNTASVSSYVWQYTGFCRYLRLSYAPTAGRLTSVTTKVDGLKWTD